MLSIWETNYKLFLTSEQIFPKTTKRKTLYGSRESASKSGQNGTMLKLAMGHRLRVVSESDEKENTELKKRLINIALLTGLLLLPSLPSPPSSSSGLIEKKAQNAENSSTSCEFPSHKTFTRDSIYALLHVSRPDPATDCPPEKSMIRTYIAHYTYVRPYVLRGRAVGGRNYMYQDFCFDFEF